MKKMALMGVGNAVAREVVECGTEMIEGRVGSEAGFLVKLATSGGERVLTWLDGAAGNLNGDVRKVRFVEYKQAVR